MQEMLRKKYRLSVEFFGRFRKPKTIHFEFLQGTLAEILEMKEELDDAIKINKWLFDFLMKKTNQSDKLTLKLYEQLGTDQKNNILEFLLRTYAKGFFKKNEGEKEKVVEEKTPSSSMICLILEKTSERMESLLAMTWEQIEYIIEGIVWNMNAQSKKGKEVNARKMRMKNLQKEMVDEDEMLEKLKERMDKRNLKNSQHA